MNQHAPIQSDYAFWYARLGGLPEPKVEMTKDPVTGFDVPTPQCGYYRHRTQNGRFLPLAVWRNDAGELVYQLGHGSVMAAETTFSEKVFAWASRHPVSYEEYTSVLGGNSWRDVDPVVAAQVERRAQQPTEEEALEDQITSALAGLQSYEENGIADDEWAGRAQSLRSRLLELSRDADKTREAEKAPHLEAGRAVDAKWQPLIKKAKAGADTLRKLLAAFETKKVQAAREEAAKREAEQAKTDVASHEPEPEQPKKVVRGGYGRAASVRMVRVVKTITDQDALYRHFAGTPEIYNELKRLAQIAVARGEEVPGIEIEEQADVR